MHKYSHHIENSLSECVLTIHRQTSLRPFFCIALAEIFFRRPLRLYFFFSLAEFFPALARRPFAGYGRQTDQNISSKFAKCRCFDFRYIIFGLLKAYLWKMEQFVQFCFFRIIVMWQKRYENEIL